jgi:hypothetical protein
MGISCRSSFVALKRERWVSSRLTRHRQENSPKSRRPHTRTYLIGSRWHSAHKIFRADNGDNAELPCESGARLGIATTEAMKHRAGAYAPVKRFVRCRT